ncbi:MAG TPA: hypothetical protein H9952_05160 [Candidatus Massiliomicrobiota merdigallinarum]|nr:hypothetical protein [Candidatus Massilimicrobiota merdigallinarum]
MMKIKQIELKDVDLTTLNENEIYYCELNNYYIQDLYYEQIGTLLEKIRKQSDVVLFKVEKEVEDENDNN